MVLQAQPPKSPFQLKRSGTPGDAQNLIVGSFPVRIKFTDLLPLVFVLIAMLIVEFTEKIHGSVHIDFGVKLVIAGPRAGIRQHIIGFTYVVELTLGIDPIVKVFVRVIHVREPVVSVFNV